MTARFLLRKQLRQARRAIPDDQRRSANACIHRQLIQHPRFRRARRIALYFSTGGEVNLSATIAYAQTVGKTVLIPRVVGSRLAFVPWTRNDTCIPGRYGIDRPALRAMPQPVRHIDVIVTPLVGFDVRGARLGQGGGYYDRALASRLNSNLRRPYLIGVAFAVQRVAHIDTNTWDVPMDTIIHDSHTHPRTPMRQHPTPRTTTQRETHGE